MGRIEKVTAGLLDSLELLVVAWEESLQENGSLEFNDMPYITEMDWNVERVEKLIWKDGKAYMQDMWGVLVPLRDGVKIDSFVELRDAIRKNRHNQLE